MAVIAATEIRAACVGRGFRRGRVGCGGNLVVHASLETGEPNLAECRRLLPSQADQQCGSRWSGGRSSPAVGTS